MCLATVDDGRHATASFRLEIRALYLRLSSAAQAPAGLSLVYLPAIGGAALELDGRALPPAAPAEVPLRRVSADGSDAAYASDHRVCAAEGARFEVYAGKDLAADGVFSRRRRGGWRVECRRATLASTAVVAEVVVLEEGGALMRAKAKASARGLGCGGTRLEGIPEEGWWACECGTCGDDEWEVVGDDGDDCKGELDTPEMEAETLTWALEMGAWAVCVGVGILATARRFRRKRAF
ncbi:hypothetical protein E2562_000751 [Oryza meyeriana var. granulata]|uniref:Uncharacterized protein n=1 Tax=Oryza meyeriana var. granulata TaxID=110450 RepID=A0A6G1DVM0_9ORYZ|nr:hypothetical protein E2562_000751 [Oryza meyeriana var. granulata]